MKLNMGDLIKYDGAIYEVVAVVWSTLYLRAVNSDRYDYKIDNLGKLYRDIEFLGKCTAASLKQQQHLLNS